MTVKGKDKVALSPKKLVVLFACAACFGAVTALGVEWLARRQIISQAAEQHARAFSAYMKLVEGSRKAERETTLQQEASGPAASAQERTTQPADSPYWKALHELRHQFPSLSLEITLNGSRYAMSREWVSVEEKEGWVRSSYILSTRNVAAFEAASNVRTDLLAWEQAGLVVCACSFIVLFIFGCLWAWVTFEPSQMAKVAALATEVSQAMQEIDKVLGDVKAGIDHLQRTLIFDRNTDFRSIDDLAAQIKLLSINGSLEAVRSAETQKVFQALMQEINSIATQMRALLQAASKNIGGAGDLRNLLAQIEQAQAALSLGTLSSEESSDVAQSSSRRVG